MGASFSSSGLFHAMVSLVSGSEQRASSTIRHAEPQSYPHGELSEAPSICPIHLEVMSSLSLWTGSCANPVYSSMVFLFLAWFIAKPSLLMVARADLTLIHFRPSSENSSTIAAEGEEDIRGEER